MSTEVKFNITPVEAKIKPIMLDENTPLADQIRNITVNATDFDSQVKVKKNRAPKRNFSKAYKLQILKALDACKDRDKRGALLRKEGLYYARISAWRKQFQDGGAASNKTPKSVLLMQQLTREIATLKKKLSQAEAIIDLQKKVSELLSINILDHDTSEI